MKTCPYCYNTIDDAHSVTKFKDAEIVGCPKYPRNDPPMFVNNQLWQDYEPTKKQVEFFDSAEKHVLYGIPRR